MEIIRRLFSFWSHHTIAGTLCRLEAQAKAAILCLCGAFPAPLLWWSGPLSLPPRTTLLLIYRIQSHTHPKRRKFCLKHAGQKSVKEELPEHWEALNRAQKSYLKGRTYFWENTPRPPHNFISGCSAVGSAPALGAGCRRFESCHSDHLS